MMEAVVFLAVFTHAVVVQSATDPDDLAILNQFKQGLENADLLQWPNNGSSIDPCGSPSWPHVYCSGDRVTQIQVRGLGLKGTLPRNLNKLSMLENLGLQQNQFNGSLPSFSGLSLLRFAYLDSNNFDTIPSDFFSGLSSVEVLALDYNPLNASTGGWSLPSDLEGSTQLKNLSLIGCNLIGPLPGFLGKIPSLEVLLLSYNGLGGGIPESFSGSLLTMLWLNDQTEGLTGSIDVVATMVSLTYLWLHGNHFSGRIPGNIGDLVSLQDLDLNRNNLVGFIPPGLANMTLKHLDLNNNGFMGPLPDFKAANATYKSNQFCLPDDPGVPCAPDVMSLLDFLDGVGFPNRLVQSWYGNSPCGGSWLGIGCDSKGNVDVIDLPSFNLSGTLSSSISNLASVSRINLRSNNLSGSVPEKWTSLKSLTVLDLSGNNLSPPLPGFRSDVKVILDGNSLFDSKSSYHGGAARPSLSPNGTASSTNPDGGRVSKRLVVIVAPVASFAFLVCFVVPLSLYIRTKRKKRRQLAPSSLVVHPMESGVKITVADPTSRSGVSSPASGSIRSGSHSHAVESGGLVISVQVLRKVTNDFAPENELGRGGFGVVYKGELDDGTKIAVKRMEAGGAICSKGLEEFRSEIAVLSKVRHRHLVSLLGYSVEGNERILVYEYMAEGALSTHLFHWRKLGIEPLTWKRRLNIALDVARGIEYLHTLAHRCFIHRDLKSSNILLGDDFHAKVSDFGLVKLAPDGDGSVVTRLAGTFGYLAPEYAVTGKITTKADVFSFGVVLLELLTGMSALDECRPEESQYLVAWFWKMKANRDSLTSAVDPVLEDAADDESIAAVAELASHCTAREPGQRPDIGHAVNVLASLVDKWKPSDDDAEEYCGIDYSLPLNEMVRDWKEKEEKESLSYVDMEDTQGSIPARPAGFAESFTSADGRVVEMVKHKSQPKKPKKGGVDFKKYKRKVGRKLPPPKNATNTEVKSKAIVLPEQSIVSQKEGLAVSHKGLTLKELLQHTNHHNAKVRKDALLGIKEILLKHPPELKLHKLAVVEKLRERMGDDDKIVRETLYQLFKSVVLPACAKDFSNLEILHGYDFKVEVESNGPIAITKQLKDLLHIIVGCFLDFMPSVHDLIVRYLISEVRKSEQDQLLNPHLQNSGVGSSDILIIFSMLKKLWNVFPLNMNYQLSGKDDHRIFMFNIAITEILMRFRNWDEFPSALPDKVLEFIEVSLATKIESGNISYEKSLLPLIPYISKLVTQVSFDWRYRLLQDKGGGLLSLDSVDPTLLDYHIAWFRNLPSLLISLADKNPSCSKFYGFNSVWGKLLQLTLYFRGNSTTCIFNAAAGIHYGPFISLAPDIQELAICCLYYFSFIGPELLQSLLSCCSCHDLRSDTLLRILEVLQSAFRAGHIQVGDYASFHVTLLSRFRVSTENNSSPAEIYEKKRKWIAFKRITRSVRSYISDIGDAHLVFQMLEKIIIDQICGEIPLENKCGFLRLLVKLDSNPTRLLSPESLHGIGSALHQYLIDVVSVSNNNRTPPPLVHAIYISVTNRISLPIHLQDTGEEDEGKSSGSAAWTVNRREYYLAPLFRLISRSEPLLSRVLSSMGSRIFDSGYGEMKCVTFVLLRLFGSDAKTSSSSSRRVLVCCEAVVEETLKNLHNLLDFENLKLSFEERHRIRSEYDRVRGIVATKYEQRLL
ncbi:hypothetical protein M569_04331 [Genlisea aurea]|uniref:Protein kinase domain-containing protein n=1 Tax=Genlisea aurea TaxID=192259 RepID=S8CZC3_9LAMI|nr:hypothetical protein M569_04331 [Genlisea aurea]